VSFIEVVMRTLTLLLGLLVASCAGSEQDVVARPPTRAPVLQPIVPPPTDVSSTQIVGGKGRGTVGMEHSFAASVALATPVVRPTVFRPRPTPMH
jgi:hypothetical protein